MACAGNSDVPGCGLSNRADLLETFFNLLAQILKKNPQLFVTDERVDLAALFQCGECRCLFNYCVTAFDITEEELNEQSEEISSAGSGRGSNTTLAVSTLINIFMGFIYSETTIEKV
jgi:hypothetical protein